MWTWKSLGKLKNSLYILLQNILVKTPGAHAVGLKLEELLRATVQWNC